MNLLLLPLLETLPIAEGVLVLSLDEATTKLQMMTAGGAEDDVRIRIGQNHGERVEFNAVILPFWQKFADALHRVNTGSPAIDNEAGIKGRINLCIENVHFSGEIVQVLEPALKAASINAIILNNSGLDGCGLEFLERIVEENRFTNAFSIMDNEVSVECGSRLLSLVQSAGLKSMLLTDIGINNLFPAVPELLPAILSLEKALITETPLGSASARLIANGLAGDPAIQSLHLQNNSLTDSDASLFVTSLKTNRKLRFLDLHNNNFTNVGYRALYRAVYDNESLDSINNSSHLCQLVLFGGDDPVPEGIDTEVLLMNGEEFGPESFSDSLSNRYLQIFSGVTEEFMETMQMIARKKVKMLYALEGEDSDRTFDMNYLKDVPLELMPEVLNYIDECIDFARTEERLDCFFEVIRGRPQVTSFNEVQPMMKQQQSKKRRIV